ncbi:MAG TPA: UDP-N-acetylmuramoyl-tripeptide--D-alanyl-D-alanine ligase [Bacillota bacterium]|jgi:UDP-N-acetylmuramoyl-tripeptide--D-alanyl-D-alanine ligase|nr:UDP-N-acetylmuramoyl-tripeptide--D-alanyl-D-alanine ligase [Bacillota bacterium]
MQLKHWTGGELRQTGKHAADSERYYPSISTDTRTLLAGQVFVPLRGDLYDGHAFLDAAAEKGAGMLVIESGARELAAWLSRLERDQDAPDLLLVEDAGAAFRDMARGFRSTLAATVIGVTGSVGKTTTRRMICQMIETQVKAEQSARNFNNQVGLPRTILATRPDTQVLVAEMGMARRGEIRILSAITVPDIAIITQIGMSHAEWLGSMNDILAEKTSITAGMKENGLLIVNGDDPLLESWVLQDPPSVPVWFTASEQNAGRLERGGFPVFWSEHVRVDRQGLSFTGRSNLAPDERWPVYLKLPARHLIPAALFGLATVYAMGLNMQEAAASARRFTTADSRQELIRVGSIDVMDDSYNASPESLHSALETASFLAEGNRRLVMVLGGLKELGRYSDQVHEEAALELLEAGVDRVILVGAETVRTREHLLADGRGAAMVAGWYETCQEAIPAVLSELEPGDFLLLKASRFYELDKIGEALQHAGLEREH